MQQNISVQEQSHYHHSSWGDDRYSYSSSGIHFISMEKQWQCVTNVTAFRWIWQCSIKQAWGRSQEFGGVFLESVPKRDTRTQRVFFFHSGFLDHITHLCWVAETVPCLWHATYLLLLFILKVRNKKGTIARHVYCLHHVFFLRPCSLCAGTLPYEIKIVIAGNHELTFDQEFMADLIKQDFYYFPSASKLKPENYENVQSLLTNCIYLQDSDVTVRGFRIYGSPWWVNTRVGNLWPLTWSPHSPQNIFIFSWQIRCIYINIYTHINSVSN